MTALAYVPEPFGCRYADGCRGVRVNPYQGCWAHLDPEDRGRALSHLEPGGRIDARGTHLTPELLTKILAALLRDSGPPELGDASFDNAQFAGDASFGAPLREARFNGNARFGHARFSHDASFRKAQFSGDAGFMGTQFDGDARLEEACLEAERVLGPVLVEGRLVLEGVAHG